jgi:hypothetical protein
MRALAFTILLLVLRCGSASLFAQTANDSKSKDEVSTSLVEMERQWAEVCATHDSSVLERILSDDFIGTNTEGKHYTKSEDIEKVRRSTKRYKSGRLDDVKVRFYGGDIAVLQGVETCVREADDGKEEPETAVWTDTWIKRNGLWQIIAAQDAIYQTATQQASTVIPGPRATASQSDANSVAAQIIAAEDRYTQAYLRRDWEAASALLAPDYYANAEGFEGDRTKLEREFPKIHLLHYEVVSTPHLKLLAPDLVLYNDVATMRETYGERDISGRYWHGDIWVRRNDRWVLLVEQEVWLREPATASPNVSK